MTVFAPIAVASILAASNVGPVPPPAKPTGIYYTFATDASAENAALFRSLGASSVECYVTWETCESQGEGKWDWSRWDKQVQDLKDNDLKLVPFLIVGPAYATPKWFREGKDNVPCACLEHGIKSEIQSLWNPNLPKWIDRFIGEFAKRYGTLRQAQDDLRQAQDDGGIIESVLLGVQGDFGEAIYSVTGGGWTGKYHQHQGYWCNDPYALADFRDSLRKKYASVDVLNKTWGTSYASFSAVDFQGRGMAMADFEKLGAVSDPCARRRWLDFIDWYRASMTRWSDWWMETARKHFPNKTVYLCTGGDASPAQGSDFGEQCRIAAKHKGGVWITNEASKYSLNHALTRWVASAGKHYGAAYAFEPAGHVDESGLVARIYNATASGANRLMEYNGNMISSEARKNVQRANLKHLYKTQPIVPVAAFYPNNVALALYWYPFLDKVLAFRDYTDLDLVDENMLRTGALKHYKVLMILHGDVIESKDAALIADWVKKGGRVIVAGVPKFESVEVTDEPEKALFGDTPRGRSLGKGSIHRFDTPEEAAIRLDSTLKEFGLPIYDSKADGLYGTQIAPTSFLFLNTGKEPAEAKVTLGSGKSWTASIPAGGIGRIEGK